jgi:replicative DNA helicase
MDEVLDGGLMPGEEGVIMAPLGYGKSMTLVAFGAHAWLKGKHVVHFSFENSAKETLARYLANMTGVPRHELLAEGEDSETLNYAVRRSKESGGIIAIERLIGSMTNIRRLEAALIGIENQYDIKADLVIIDYGDLMVPLKSSSGRKYEDMQNVFAEIRDLAASCEVPIWTATQTNRTGLEAKRVKTSHISDSLGKAMTADLILGFSRPQKDADADPGADITGDVAEFQILKNRRGEEPKAPFKAVTNFALARFDAHDDAHAEEIQDAKDESALKHNKIIRASKTQKAKHGK